MFPNYCTTVKNAKRQNQNYGSYYLKEILDEDRRVNELKEQEILVTAENPRIKIQQESTNICKELRECKEREILEQKRRQQLRTNSFELRKLTSQLQCALVSKQLKEQKIYSTKQKEDELRSKREEDTKWAEECERTRKAILQQEEKDKQKKAQFRGVLQKQMSEGQQRRRMEFEDIIKDRDEMLKVVKRVNAEEKAERDMAERYKEKCKTEMEECYRNREVQRQLEKEKHFDDTERYLEYQRECDELKARRAAARNKIQLEKQALSAKIGQQLANVNNEKEKRENLLLSLLVEERKAKEDERYRQNLEKQEKERQQLRCELENYRNEIKVQKERKLDEEERQMREEHMRYLAERDKLDQLSDEKRRRKIVEHNKALREIIEMRRNQRVADMSERIVDYEKILNDEKAKDQLIEEERIRMLRTTPAELLMYLPAGVLKPSDREFLHLPEQNN